MTNYLTRAEDRINAILTGSPDRFAFETQTLNMLPKNLTAQYFEQTWSFPTFFSEIPTFVNTQWNAHGAAVVNEYASSIELYSGHYGVDPDIVKAVIYTENARGYYGAFPTFLVFQPQFVLEISIATYGRI